MCTGYFPPHCLTATANVIFNNSRRACFVPEHLSAPTHSHRCTSMTCSDGLEHLLKLSLCPASDASLARFQLAANNTSSQWNHSKQTSDRQKKYKTKSSSPAVEQATEIREIVHLLTVVPLNPEEWPLSQYRIVLKWNHGLQMVTRGRFSLRHLHVLQPFYWFVIIDWLPRAAERWFKY